MKKVPERTCVITKEKLPKSELVRVVRTPDLTVVVDYTGRTNGRGAYLSKSKEALEICRKKKILERHLEVQIPDEVFMELERIINE